MAQREADERAACVRVGVGRALAREVRREQDTVRARRVLRGFLVERPVVDADDVAEPAERAGGGEHDAHRVPRVGHRVAEDVCARERVGRERIERREDDARRSEHDGERAGLDDADAERGRCLVSRTRDLRRLVRARKPLVRDLERVAHLVAPAPLRDVEEERPDASATSVVCSPASRSRT